jgi:hypothetical protein
MELVMTNTRHSEMLRTERFYPSRSRDIAASLDAFRVGIYFLVTMEVV